MEKQTTVDRLGEIYSVHDPARDKREMYVHRIPGKILKIGVGPSGGCPFLSHRLYTFSSDQRANQQFILYFHERVNTICQTFPMKTKGEKHFSILIYVCQAWVSTTILSNEIFRLRDTHVSTTITIILRVQVLSFSSNSDDPFSLEKY